MVEEKQRADWSKQRRLSLRALPVVIGLLVVVCILLYAATLVVDVPTWLAIVLVGCLAFTVIGDLVNIAYLTWRLRRENGARRASNGDGAMDRAPGLD